MVDIKNSPKTCPLIIKSSGIKKSIISVPIFETFKRPLTSSVRDKYPVIIPSLT